MLLRWWWDSTTRAGGGRRNDNGRSKEGVEVTMAVVGEKCAESGQFEVDGATRAVGMRMGLQGWGRRQCRRTDGGRRTMQQARWRGGRRCDESGR